MKAARGSCRGKAARGEPASEKRGEGRRFPPRNPSLACPSPRGCRWDCRSLRWLVGPSVGLVGLSAASVVGWPVGPGALVGGSGAFGPGAARGCAGGKLGKSGLPPPQVPRPKGRLRGAGARRRGSRGWAARWGFSMHGYFGKGREAVAGQGGSASRQAPLPCCGGLKWIDQKGM